MPREDNRDRNLLVLVTSTAYAYKKRKRETQSKEEEKKIKVVNLSQRLRNKFKKFLLHEIILLLNPEIKIHSLSG